MRVVVEKPFGRDLASAQALGKTVLAAFDESQVYRIDHYVGKETVQNVLVLRSANAIFEALWSREFISHVEISAAEKVGLEGRGGYYETSGVIRDMFQNHLLQLVALTAMEPPQTASADHVRDEKVKVLQGDQADRRGRQDHRRPRASTPPGRSTDDEVHRLPRGAGGEAGVAHAHVRGPAARDRHGAVARGSLLRPLGQAHGPGASRRSPSTSSRRAS